MTICDVWGSLCASHVGQYREVFFSVKGHMFAPSVHKTVLTESMFVKCGLNSQC